MPIPELMTWVPSRRRWTRMHDGKRFWISCKALGAPETKEGSVRAANAWWTAKQAELDAANKPIPRTPKPMEDLAGAAFGCSPDELADRLVTFWTNRSGDAREMAERDFEGIVKNVVSRIFERHVLSGEPLPEGFGVDLLPPARVEQVHTAIKGLRGESPAPPDRTVKVHVDRWIATQQALVKAGSLAPDRADNNRICLEHFAGFIGETAGVDTIGAERLHNFYLWCLRKVEERSGDARRKAGWSTEYAKKVFGTARAFVRFLWESDLIDMPRNLNSKTFRFNGGTKAIQTWTAEEVNRVIGEAPGQLKLHLLLMANCGFTQVDASDLLDSEVDWKGGRIVRKRSKTGDKESTPTVDYKLWPMTFHLLKQYRSGKEVALLTESGRPFVRKELVNGKLVKADNIASNFAHLKRRLKFKKPMKQLRKTAATMLESHEVYGRFVTHFLGHSPRTVAAKHYAAPSQTLFDEAVLWLGHQLGQGGSPGA